MGEALYRDPTFEAAARLEISEKGCRVCVRRVELSGDRIRCGVGREFPRCRGLKHGFVLDMGAG